MSYSIEKTSDETYILAHSDIPGFPDPDSNTRTVRFSVLELCKSIARCNALTSANHSLLNAMTAANLVIFRHIIDGHYGFKLTPEVLSFGDMKGNVIAHDLGVGISDLYMESLGFYWRSTAAELLKGRGKKADYLYAHHLSSSDLALMESKGSLKAQKNTFKKKVEGGFNKQIQPHLKKKIDGKSISSGYAIGTLSRVSQEAEILIYRTSWSTPPTTSYPAYGSEISRKVAFSNYESCFRLMGISGILRSSEMQKKNALMHPIYVFYEVKIFDGTTYLIHAPLLENVYIDPEHLWHWRYPLALFSKLPLFGIETGIAKALLTKTEDADLKNLNVNLPLIDQGLLADINGDKARLHMSPDGLTLCMASRPFEIVGRWDWSFETGLVQHD